jgi:hypothetical protein
MERPRTVFTAAPGEENSLHNEMITAARIRPSVSAMWFQASARIQANVRLSRIFISSKHSRVSSIALELAQLIALVVVFASAHAVCAQDARQFVEKAVQAELAADAADHSHWLYFEVDQRPGNAVKQWVAETLGGNLVRVVEQNGQAIPEQVQRSKMESFAGTKSDQARQRKSERHDDEQAEEMLRTLPRAFIWSKIRDENGDTILHFKPDPAFHPPDYEERVFAAMEGDMTVNDQQQRIVSLKGTLIHDVKFLGGLFGYLQAGGTFDVERRETGKGLWQIVETHIHIQGRALFFKNIGEQEDDVKSRFKQLPDNIAFPPAENDLMAQR